MKKPNNKSPTDSEINLSDMDFDELDKFGEISADFADELSGCQAQDDIGEQMEQLEKILNQPSTTTIAESIKRKS